jgi:hypothetical protein
MSRGHNALFIDTLLNKVMIVRKTGCLFLTVSVPAGLA